MSSETIQTVLSISAVKLQNLRGNHAFALQRHNFPHPIWPPSPHIVSFKEPSASPPPPRRHPLARNHLRGLFQIAKSFSTVSVSHNAQKQAFLPFEDGTLCGLSDLSVEDEGKNAKQSVARP